MLKFEINLNFNNSILNIRSVDSSYIPDSKSIHINGINKDLKNKWKKKLNRDQIIKIQKGYSILPAKHYEEFKI